MLQDYLESKCDLLHLYVDFSDGKTVFCGHSAPSGQFAADVLAIPESVIDEVLQYSLSVSANMKLIAKGVADHSVFADCRYKLVQMFLKIGKYPPFSYLDMDKEVGVIKELISESGMSRLLKNEHKLLEYYRHEGGEQPNDDRLPPSDKHALEHDLLDIMSVIERLETALSFPLSVGLFYYTMKTFSGLVAETHARTKNDLASVVKSLFSDETYWKDFDNELFRIEDYLDYGQNTKIALIPIESESGETVLVERCMFKVFSGLLLRDFFKGLEAGHYTRECENCGRYFLVEKATYQRFCNGVDPNNPKKSCQAAGRQLPVGKRQSVKDIPAHILWKASDELIRKHKQRGKIDEKACADALALIREYYNEALCDQKYAIGRYYDDMELKNVYEKVGVRIR